MASFAAVLEVKGHRFPLLSYDLSIHQETDSLGRPASPTLGGTIDCVLSAPGPEQPFLHQWMFSPTIQEDGKIILLQESPKATLKTIRFFNAYCTGLQTTFSPGGNGGGSLQMHIRISPQRVAVGAIIHDNNWPLESHGAGETFAREPVPPANSKAVRAEEPSGFMEGLHGVLDVVGMIPVLGEVADAANAAVYLSEGRYGEAALSAASMIPLAGNAIGAAKLLRRGAKVLDKVRDVKAFANARKASAKLNKAVDEVFAGIKKCTEVGHPVDVATGILFTTATDLSLPGLIPLNWERTWYSASTYQGPLGRGWHYQYDWGLALEAETGIAVVRMADGRQVSFAPPQLPGQPVFDIRSGLTLHRPLPAAPQPAPWIIMNKADGLYYTFAPPTDEGSYQPLNSIENETGQFIGFRYQPNRQLEQITDSAGRILMTEYTQQGQLGAVYGPHPELADEQIELVRYAYSEANNLISVTDAEANVTSFVYDNQHRLIQETNAVGLSFYFDYEPTRPDLFARCVHTWGDGAIFDTKLQYIDGQTTLVWDSYDQQTRYTHQDGLVISQVDALGHEQRWIYDEDQQLVALTDGLGQTIRYRYDESGNLLSTRYADDTRQDTDYDEAHRPVSQTDARGNSWLYSYDEQSLLTAQTDPLGNQTRYVYDDQGRLTTVIDALGQPTQLRYNEHHQLVHVITPDEQIRSRSYDALGCLTKLTDPAGLVQQRQYDRLGRLVRLIEPDDTQQLFRYDGLGNVVDIQQGDQVVSFSYNGLNRLAERRQADQRVQYRYDQEGRLTGLINEAGLRYRFGLDATGETVEEEGFDGLLRRYDRDTAGRITRVWRPAGRHTTYEYTPTGEISLIRYSDGWDETFTYDEAGSLVRAANNQTTVRLERDALGRVCRDAQDEHWVEYHYDALGQRSRVRSSLGADLTLEHDALGNVSRMNADEWQAQFDYDSRGLEMQRKLSGGVLAGWQRDALGRPVRQRIRRGGEERQRHYQWKSNGWLNQLDDTKTGISQYNYDLPGTLTQAHYADGLDEARFTDTVGNLFDTSALTDRKYGPGGQLLSSRQAHYHYDPEGNLLSKTDRQGRIWQYEWSDKGALSAVVRPDQHRVSFTYDALGRRLRKHYKGKTTHWVWDANNPLHEWNELGLDGQNTDEVITWLFEADSFIPVARLQGTNRQSIVTDVSGVPLEMIDQHGQCTWQAETTIYGRVRLREGTRADCPFRFQGQYEDVETGLYYNRFRYYDPAEGTYVSQDPIRLRGGHVLYGYVGDPVNYGDPFGLGKCALTKVDAPDHDYTLTIRKADYPETAGHIEEAISAGHPGIFTVNRGIAKANRKNSLKGYPTRPNLDRDEWPMAMTSEGGTGAHIKYINPSDNRGAGSAIGNALESVVNGEKVKIIVTN